MKVLFHICCVCCSIYVHRRLKENFTEVVGFWYNPNIHPLLEYQKRKEAVKTWGKKENLKIIYSSTYDIDKYFKKIKESKKCELCYEIRLEKTARCAKNLNFGYFTTTLLISPYQKKEEIKIIGEKLQDKFGVKFYFEDFTPGFRESKKCARELNLYQQKYCGCIYSYSSSG